MEIINKKTADLPGGLSGSLCRFYCHWQRTIKYLIKILKSQGFFEKILNINNNLENY